MAHIRVIEPEEASGELKTTYDDLAAKRGKLAEVHKVQSLHPETIVQHMDLYMELMYGSSPLTRYGSFASSATLPAYPTPSVSSARSQSGSPAIRRARRLSVSTA
jgi:hypothetical protein